MGVAAVCAALRHGQRWFGPAAGLLAGALLALTPVAVLMFRFNNPDALMVLLIVAAAYCITRAIEAASTRWLLLAGVCDGILLPGQGSAAVHRRARPGPGLLGGRPDVDCAGACAAARGRCRDRRRRRLVDPGGAADAGRRPPVHRRVREQHRARAWPSATTASAAITGASGAARRRRRWRRRQLQRRDRHRADCSTRSDGGQISWLLPAALIAIVALAVVIAGAPRTDRTRAAAACCGAAGCSSPARCSASPAASSTRTTPSSSRRRSPRSSPSGRSCCGGRGPPLAARVALAAGVLVTGLWTLLAAAQDTACYPWLAWLVVLAAAVSAALFLTPPGQG